MELNAQQYAEVQNKAYQQGARDNQIKNISVLKEVQANGWIDISIDKLIAAMGGEPD